MLTITCLAAVLICCLWLYAHRQPTSGARIDTRVQVYAVEQQLDPGDAPQTDDVRLGPLIRTSGSDVAELFDGLVYDRASCGYRWPAFVDPMDEEPQYMARLSGPEGTTDVIFGLLWVRIYQRNRSAKLIFVTDRLDCTTSSWSFENARWIHAFRTAIRGQI